MNTRRDLTRLARFMTRWLEGRGRGGWIVVAQIERDEPYPKRHRPGRMLLRGHLWVKDRATMRKRPRLLARGRLVKGEENARESLLSQCWKILGAKSVEEVALRWAVFGDGAVLDWFDGNSSRPWKGREL